MKNGNSIHYTYDALGRKRGKSIVTLKSVVDVPMGQLHSALADEIKTNRKIYYCSNLELAGLTKIGLFMVHIPDGYILSADLVFQITDHLGNVCAETGSGGHEIATYYPSGIRVDNSATYLNSDYAFANKEFQSSHRLNLYDFGERYYEMHLSHWTTMDPLCEKYYWLSPYSYCGGNPVNRIDPTGADWILVSDADGERYEWRDGSSYDTGKKEKNGNNIILEGHKAVVIFNGSQNERLGKDGTLTGDDAIAAKVTIYGINGKDDVKEYAGLSVSSDPSKFSMIKDGEYDGRWEQMATSLYAKGALTYRISQNQSDDLLPEGGVNIRNNKSTMSAIFFHRTDWSGKATKASEGCLVIDGRQWRNVEKQLQKTNSFKIILKRK